MNSRFLSCDVENELFEERVLQKTIIHCFCGITEEKIGMIPSDVKKSIRDQLDSFF